MADLFSSLFRAVLGFTILLILVRLIGNKQLGQLNVFTYISGITIGSMMGELVLHKDLKIFDSLLCIAVWGILVFVIETISLKSTKARELLDGQPIILIKEGVIVYESLRKERLNIDDLTMMLRTNNVFSVADVNYAILEPNGDLSILKKQGRESISRDDMNIEVKQTNYMPTTIVMDGRIIFKNLTQLSLTIEWLNEVLCKAGIQNENDILYAELQGDGKLYIQLTNGQTGLW